MAKHKKGNAISLKPLMASIMLFGACTANATPAQAEFTIEEKRIAEAESKIPAVIKRHQALINEFSLRVNTESNSLRDVIKQDGNTLWLEATAAAQTLIDGDDRALYWSRLKMSKVLRKSQRFTALDTSEQADLLWLLELATRGKFDVNYNEKVDVKILLTGFDPFFLHKHIDQSNPSGVTAMMLDGKVIEIAGVKAQIETFVVPVRFADFDQGMIEELLTPYVKSSVSNDGIDYLFTVSMGRKDFDLERFPALRRSAEAPDNLMVYTGANAESPLVPLLNGEFLNSKKLKGPEFVEFSLPVKTMQSAQTTYKVIDNRKIKTLNASLEPESLKALTGKVSVSGSGGGYLSNEISYRSILLRNKYNRTLPVGHIHTPRIAAFEPEVSLTIAKDIMLMLEKVVKHHE